VAKAVKIKELAELAIDKPNLLHIEESYLRQVTHGKPPTASKKNKAAVECVGAKWYRQKGTGRARQGARNNPHLRGGGLAFPPHPRIVRKRLNKQVRKSAFRSAVLWHIENGSAFVIKGKDFPSTEKTKAVAAALDNMPGTVCLVLNEDTPVWRASRNLPYVRLVTPAQVNVRDVIESEYLAFTEDTLSEFSELLKQHVAAVSASDESVIEHIESETATAETEGGEK